MRVPGLHRVGNSPQPRRLVAAAAVVVALAARGAVALPLVGDETIVDVTAAPDLSAQCVSASPIGPASTNALGELVLPISGGDVDFPLLEGAIEHAGGVQLDCDAASPTILLEDLVIDLTGGSLTATVTVLDGEVTAFMDAMVPIFDVRACLFSTASDPCFDDDGSVLLNGYGLDFTGTLAMVANEFFGTSFEAGDAFGVAYPDLRPVPEPVTGAVLGAGLAGLGLLGRRRARPDAGRG